VETKPEEDTSKQYAWMTNISVTKSTCVPIANQGGRLRWNIENQGFNAQKNGGYHLEHAYTHNVNADKCFYLLLQMAHTINQLIEKGSLLSKETRKKIGSIRNIARLLLENIRTAPNKKQNRFRKGSALRHGECAKKGWLTLLGKLPIIVIAENLIPD
jgi:hypothetical protein